MSVVAVFSADEDTVLLRPLLRGAGYQAVGAYIRELRRGDIDPLALFRHAQPDVVIYDVEAPLKANWNFLRLIRNSPAARGRPFILLTSNKSALLRVIGRQAITELIFEKPFDLGEVLNAVRLAADDRAQENLG